MKKPTSLQFKEAHEALGLIQKLYPRNLEEAIELLSDPTIRHLVRIIAKKSKLT